MSGYGQVSYAASGYRPSSSREVSYAQDQFSSAKKPEETSGIAKLHAAGIIRPSSQLGTTKIVAIAKD